MTIHQNKNLKIKKIKRKKKIIKMKKIKIKKKNMERKKNIKMMMMHKKIWKKMN